MHTIAPEKLHSWFGSKKVVLVLISIGFTFLLSGFLIFGSNLFNPKETIAPLSNSTSDSPEKRAPARITIPSIGVDALVKPVGLTEINTMESPDKKDETAWFELGVSPGEIGSSVIVGHSGWTMGRAIFDDLDKIKQGDKVYVEDADGHTLTFVVRRIQTYDALGLAPEVWNIKDIAHLNLITCSGDWDKETKNFPKRLVVFTDLETY